MGVRRARSPGSTEKAVVGFRGSAVVALCQAGGVSVSPDTGVEPDSSVHRFGARGVAGTGTRGAWSRGHGTDRPTEPRTFPRDLSCRTRDRHRTCRSFLAHSPPYADHPKPKRIEASFATVPIREARTRFPSHLVLHFLEVTTPAIRVELHHFPPMLHIER